MNAKLKDTGAVARSLAARRALTHLFREYERAREERDAAIDRVARFEEVIRHFIEGLPAYDQAEFTKRFKEIREGSAALSRGGETFGNVIALFQKEHRPEWSVTEIQSELRKAGAEPDQKSLYNTINYLAKTGRLKRVSRGRYVVADIGIGLEIENADYGSARLSEHDD